MAAEWMVSVCGVCSERLARDDDDDDDGGASSSSNNGRGGGEGGGADDTAMLVDGADAAGSSSRPNKRKAAEKAPKRAPQRTASKRGRMLPCLHIVCTVCLQDMLDLANEKGEKPKCRECGDAFVESDVSDPADIGVKRARRAKDVVQQVDCDECDEPTPAAYRCNNCDDMRNLCVAHQSIHLRSKSTKTHVLEPLDNGDDDDEPDISDEPKMCPTHAGNALVLFCEPCAIFICAICVVSAHNGHRMLTLEQAVESYRNKMRAQLQKLTDRMPTLDEALNVLTRKRTSLIAHMTSVNSGIDTTFQELLDRLEQQAARIRKNMADLETRREQLKDQASVEIQADIKTVEMQQEAVETTRQHFATAISQATGLATLEQMPLREQLRVTTVMRTRLRQLAQQEIQTEPVVREVVRFFVPKLQETIVEDPDELGAVTRLLPADVTRYTYERPSVVYKTKKNNQGLSHPRGITQLTTGLLVVCDPENDRMQVLTVENYRAVFLTRSIPTEHCNAVAALPNGGFWAGVQTSLVKYTHDFRAMYRAPLPPDPQTIMGVAVGPDETVFVTTSTGRLSAFKGDKWLWHADQVVAGSGSGLAVVGDDMLWVCDSLKDLIRVVSTVDGSPVRTVGKNDMKSPVGVSVMRTNSAHVAVAEHSRVSIWTTAGNIVYSFGVTGRQPGRFCNNGGSIVALTDGHLAVNDFNNNRVQIF